MTLLVVWTRNFNKPGTYSVQIVILNDYAHINGGAGAVAISSARHLAEIGYEVILFACVGPIEPGLEDVKNLRVVCLDQSDIASDKIRLRALAQGTWNLVAALEFSRLLDTLNPSNTIVHVHSWTKAHSISVLQRAFERGFPVIVTMHDFFTACPNGGFYVYPQKTLCHRVPLSFDCISCNCDRRNYLQKLWRVGRTFIQNKIVDLPHRVARFIPVSQFALEILAPHLPEDRVGAVLRNPIAANRAGAANVALSRTFVFVGRLNEEKAPLLFAEAARQAGVEAVFVGDGELREQIKHRYPEFRITGWLSSEDSCREIRAARALVFPSICYETLGLVVIEAAANGVPSVVSNKSAARDLVTDGQTGLHFEWGSVSSLSTALAKLSCDAVSSALGAAAYNWYWDSPWTLHAHVKDLLEVYDEVLAQGSRN